MKTTPLTLDVPNTLLELVDKWALACKKPQADILMMILTTGVCTIQIGNAEGENLPENVYNLQTKMLEKHLENSKH